MFSIPKTVFTLLSISAVQIHDLHAHVLSRKLQWGLLLMVAHFLYILTMILTEKLPVLYIYLHEINQTVEFSMSVKLADTSLNGLKNIYTVFADPISIKV